MPRPARSLSIRSASNLACSSLRAVSRVSGSSMITTLTRFPFRLMPRTAESSPRVAMTALADGEPGTLGRTTSAPVHEYRISARSYSSPLSSRLPVAS